MTPRKVTGTVNFARNLEGLRDFHSEHPAAFERAVAKLQDEVLPLLRKQPNLGRLYQRNPTAPPIVERVKERLGGGVLREFLVGEYVVLYLVGKKQLALISIRHQRELEFNVGG